MLLTKMSCNFPWKTQLFVLFFTQAALLCVTYSVLSRSGTVYNMPLTTGFRWMQTIMSGMARENRCQFWNKKSTCMLPIPRNNCHQGVYPSLCWPLRQIPVFTGPHEQIPAFWPLPEHVPRNCWKSLETLKYQFDETDAKSLSPFRS